MLALFFKVFNLSQYSSLTVLAPETCVFHVFQVSLVLEISYLLMFVVSGSMKLGRTLESIHLSVDLFPRHDDYTVASHV